MIRFITKSNRLCVSIYTLLVTSTPPSVEAWFESREERFEIQSYEQSLNFLRSLLISADAYSIGKKYVYTLDCYP